MADRQGAQQPLGSESPTRPSFVVRSRPSAAGSGAPARPSFEFRAPPSAAEVARPQLLTAATALWIGAAVVGLVAVLLPVLGLEDFQGAVVGVVERDYPQETLVLRDRVVAIATAVLIGGGILLALVEAGCALAMGSGRAGARVVLVLLLVPIALHVLLMLSVASPVSGACVVVTAVLALAAAVLMYLPGSTDWFAWRKRH